MNTDPAYPLIERYLDGLSTDKEAAALAEAVEADPDVLVALCEAAGIEASLRHQLATPEQQLSRKPRILPLWHWRRTGKWMAASVAAAALAVSAAIIFWPGHGGGGKLLAGRVSGMTVKRLPGGAVRAAPAWATMIQEDAGPMEEVEFPVPVEWLMAMQLARQNQMFAMSGMFSNGLAATFEIPVEGAAGRMFSFSEKFGDVGMEERAMTDDYLVWYRRACGVTFLPGASAHWLPERSIVAVNTSGNIQRIARIQQNPVVMGAK